MTKNYISSGDGLVPLETLQQKTGANRSWYGPPTGSKILHFTLKVLLLLFALGIGKVSAQSMGNYTFSTNTNGSLEDMSSGATVIMAVGEKDTEATTVQAIGFDFYYMGTKYTHFSANSNGQLRLHTSSSATAISSGAVSSYSSGVVTLAPMSGDNELTGGMRMKIIGSSPNRKLVVEWAAFYVYWSPSPANAGNMQLWLEEGTGALTYIYGALYNAGSSSQTRSIFASSGSTANASASITLAATPTVETAATTPVSNTIAAGSGTTTGSPLIANLGSSSNTTRRFFRFVPANTSTPADPSFGSYTGITATATTVNFVDNSTSETFFLVTRATDAAFTQNVVTSVIQSTTTAGTGTSYPAPQTGLSPSTTYYYKVQAMNEGTVPNLGATSSQATAAPASYTWVATTGSAAWGTAASWSPARTTPDATDILLFSNGGSSIATGVPAQTVRRIAVSNNTTIRLQAAAAATLTIASDGDSATNELSVESGSTLLSDGTAAALTITYSGTGSTGNIAGTMEATSATGSSTNNTFTFTGGTSSVTTVSGTLAAGQSGGTGVPVINGSASTLIFTATGTYNHKFTTSGGAIPTATWNTGSTVLVSGYTTSTSAPTSTSMAQTFSNFTWNCPSQTANMGWSAPTMTVNGTFTMTNSNTGEVRYSSGSGTLTVNNYTQSGGIFILSSSAGTATMNVAGTFNQTGGTFHSGTNALGTPVINFNGTGGAQNVNFHNAAPTGAVTYRISNAAGINLTGSGTLTSNFNINTNGGIRISTAAANPINTTLALVYGTAPTTLTYDVAGSAAATATVFPDTNGPSSLSVGIGSGNILTVPFNRTLAGTLTMTSGDIDISSNTLTLGTSATVTGTLTYTAGKIRVTTGSFTRWFATTGMPTSAGTGVGFFPMGSGANNRFVSVYGSIATLTAGGSLTVSHNAAGGITDLSSAVVMDGTYSIEKRTNSSWTISSNGITTSGTLGLRVTAGNIYATLTPANIRIFQGTSVAGTHVAGAGSSPDYTATRTGLSVAQLAQTHYIGAASADISLVYTSIATGNWGDGSTWSAGSAPGPNDTVVIASGHNVTLNGANTAGVLTINAGGTLTASSNSLAIATTLTNNGTVTVGGGTITVTGGQNTGITNATGATFTLNSGTVTLGPAGGSYRTFTNNGALTVAGGTLNINGNFVVNTGSTFAQSGGNINVDGNAAGVPGNSTTAVIVAFNVSTSAAISLTGGTFTIVDPSAATSATNSLVVANAEIGQISASTSHTFRFGDGVSTDAGGNAAGFAFYSWSGTGGMRFGNVIFEGPGGTNRAFTINGTYYNFIALGNVTVNSGAEYNNLNASATAATVLGGNLTVNAGGTFTAAQVYLGTATFTSSTTLGFAAGSSAQTISGAGTFRNLASSPTASITTLTVNNPAGVTLTTPISVSGTLTLTAGVVNTSSSALLRLGTASAAGTLSGGSSTAFVNGPFARTFASSRTASGTYSAATLFPVGKGSSYLPVYIDPTTSSGGAVIMSGEAFTSNPGTPRAGVTTLSTNRWEALPVSGNANLTNVFVRLADGAIVATNKIVQATAANGEYGAIVPATTAATGTLTTATAILAAAYSGYFAYGDLTPCTAPSAQPTALTFTAATGTSVSASFTAASGASHYLVVGYPTGSTPTAPADFATPNASALGSGAVIYYSGTATSFTASSGITAGMSYDVYVYAYNNSGCYGPVFNTLNPLMGTFTSCSAAATPAAPTALTTSSVSGSGFRISWTYADPIPAGVTFLLDVFTDSGYTTPVAGYNGLDVGSVLFKDVTGLSSATTYYARVRAKNGLCTSTNGTTSVSTNATVPYNEGFATTTTPVGYTITGWTIGAPTASTGNPGNAIYKNLYGSATTGTFTTINIGPLPANQQLAFDYKWVNFSSPYGAPDAAAGSFKVSITSDGTNYTDLMTITSDGVAGWKSVSEFDLSAYAGMAVRLKVVATRVSGDFYLMFDNIQIKNMPSCIRPTALTSTPASPTATNLSWTGSGSNFDVIYGATGFNVASAGTLVEDIATTSYQITGLTEGNTYDAYVRRDCGVDGVSAWYGPFTFKAGYFYNGGALSTMLNVTPTASSAACTPDPILSIQVPAGQRIASLTVKYSMTALPSIYDPVDDAYYDSYMSEQRSMLYSPSLGTGEADLASGVGNAAGTYSYNRAVTFANGATGTVTFALRAWRIWGGTGCSSNVQYVNAGSWQLIPVFEPIPSCLNPTALSVAYTSPSTANLSWTAPADTTVLDYEYAVTTSSTPPSSGTEVAGTSVTGYSGLTMGTTYYLHVRTECEEGTYSPWSTVAFTPSYCTPTTAYSGNVYMTSFAATGYTNLTKTSADSGYSDYSASSVSQYNGQPVNFTANFYRYSTSWTVGFNVWIDWNGDYDFNDAGENVYAGSANASTISNSFSIPPGTPAGSYRMRIRSEYNDGNALLNQSCGPIIGGEAEDYTFTVIPVPTCFKPTGVTATATGFTTANFSWTAPASGTTVGYEYAATTSSTPPASGTSVTGTSVTGVSGLTAETTYYLHVRAYCGATDGYGDWVTTSFYTGYCVPVNTSTSYYINNFATTAGVVNISNTASGLSTTGYGNFAATQKVSQVAGTPVSFTASFGVSTSSTFGLAIWVDLNRDMTFTTDERLYVSSSYSSTYSAAFTVPLNTAPGDYRMRVLADYNSTAPSTPCSFSSGSGEVEDYTFTVLPPPPSIVSFTPTTVCAQSGSTITITGANFTGTTSVKFNGVNAQSFTVDSASSISAVLPSTATTGTISVTSPDGTGTSSGSLTVNPLPVVADITGGNTTICAGSTVSLASATTGGVWATSNAAVATVDASGTVTGVSAGTVTISYTVTTSNCSSFKTTTVSVNAPASITSITPSQTVTPGESTSFTVAATGTGITYQWEVSTDGTNYSALSDSTPYSGVTTATLTISDIDMSMNGYKYRVVVTGTSPCGSVTSSAALLNVSNVGIAVHPTPATLCTSGDGTAQFTVVGTGAGLSYEWYAIIGGGAPQLVSNGNSTGITYSGQGTDTLSLSGLTAGANGNQYYAVITDNTGATATSNAATLTVNTAVQITSQPSSQTICYGGTTTTFVATHTGNAVSIQWQYSADGSAWANVADATPAGVTYNAATPGTLGITTTNATAQGMYYYRAVYNAATSCSNVISNVVTLTVTAPAITGQPSAATVLRGQSGTFAVTTSASSPTYQWQYGTSAAGPWANVTDATPVGTTYSGATTATLTVNATSTAVSNLYYYRAVVTSGGCSTASTGAQLTVSDYCTPTYSNAAANDNVSAMTITGTTFSAAPTQVTTAPYYSYLTGGTNTTTLYNGFSYTANVTVGTSGTTQGVGIWIDLNNDGDFADTNEFMGAGTFNSGTSGSITLVLPAGTTPGLKRMRVRTYRNNALVAANSCGNLGTRGNVDDFLITVTNAPDCSGTPATATVSAATASLCSSGSTTLTATGIPTFVNGIALQWYNSAGIISGATSATYTTPTITATETYYLRTTCTASGLYSESNQVTVTVNNPQVTGTTSASRCGTGTVDLQATGSAGTTLNWYSAATGGSSLGTGTTFTTPVITAASTPVVTNYYVEASTGTPPAVNGPANYLYTGGGTPSAVASPSNSYYMIFSSTSATKISSVTVYATAAGTLNLQLANSSGTVLQTYSYTITSGQANSTVSTLGTPIVLPINFDIPVGTGLRLGIATGTTASLLRNTAGATSYYGVAANGITFTGNWLADNSYWYFFYNVTVGTGCVSSRSLVTATVNPSPDFSLSASTATICAGSSSAPITVATGAADYDTFEWSPLTGVSGNNTVGWTFNPSVSTTYTLKASQSTGSACTAIKTVAVTVNPTPSAVSISPAAPSICNGETVSLTASGGSATADYSLGAQTTTTSTTGITPFSSNYEGSREQYLIRASELTALGMTAGNIKSLTFTVTAQGAGTNPQTNFSIKMAKTNATAISGGYAAIVGSYTTVFTAPSVGAPSVGERTFAFTTPYVWDGTSNIVIDICHDNDINATCSLCYSSNSTVAAMTTSFNSVYGSYADNAASCGVTASNTITSYTTRPIMKFGAENTVGMAWSPVSGLYTDATATTAYTGGPALVVYAKPSVTTTYTVTATGGNGCSVSRAATVTINDKVWTGAVSTAWNTAGNWCGNQVPVATDNVVIPVVAKQPVISGDITAHAASVSVAAGASLLVESGNVLDVTNALTVGAAATVTLENNAHLTQGAAVTTNGNTGSILVNRNSTPLYRQAYTMWSSPVAAQNLLAFSPNTYTGRFYTYNTATNSYSTISDPSVNSFEGGRGYLIRMPNSAIVPDTNIPTGQLVEGATATTYDAGTGKMIFNGKFSGVPNNGNVSVPLSTAGNSNGTGYNLVGNPYPSPISIQAFFAANSGNIGGYIYIWRKKNAETVSSAYCTLNADAEFVGNGQDGATDPNGIIQTGQGFIVKATTGSNLVFNNAMRSQSTTNDASFFRMSNTATPAPVESHRIWLNLADATHQVAQMMVGYKSNATMDVDPRIDAPFINDAQTGLNSMIGSKAYAIQGRSLPFDVNDEVPLQFKTAAAGNFTISIDHVDGLFLGDQDIFLKDYQTGTIHNLKAGSYTFASTAGTFDNRFTLVYTDSALGTDNPVLDANSIVIYKNDGKLHINTGTATMKDVTIFDIRGRLVYSKDSINASTLVISDLHVEEQMLIVKVTTTDNATASKKVVY